MSDEIKDRNDSLKKRGSPITHTSSKSRLQDAAFNCIMRYSIIVDFFD